MVTAAISTPPYIPPASSCSCANITRGIYNVFGDVDSIQYVNKIVVFGLEILKALGVALASGPLKLLKLIQMSEVLLNAAQFFPFLGYYFVPKKEHQIPQKLEERNGRVGLVDPAGKKLGEKLNSTQASYHLINKPHLALGMAAFCFATFTALVELLEALNVPVLAVLEKGIGIIPIFGKALGALVSSSFYSAGLVAFVVGLSANVIDSIRYLHIAKTDDSKDMTKGVWQLASRVAYLMFGVLILVKASAAAIALAGFATGVLGVANIVYRGQKRYADGQEQERLLALAGTRV